MVAKKLVQRVGGTKGSPLSQRIRGVRQVISETCGVLLPEIRVRENFRLKPAQYAIHINGIKVATGEVHADKLMAILTQLQTTMPTIHEQMKAHGHAPVLLVTPQLRPLLARYARLFAAGLQVLSYNEVPDDSDLNIVGTLA